VPVVKIIQKAGYSGWWTLLWFVPLANIIMLWVSAPSRPNFGNCALAWHYVCFSLLGAG
jgi:hypothetical protein